MQCFLEVSLSYATGELNQIKLPKPHKQAMEAVVVRVGRGIAGGALLYSRNEAIII